MSSLAFHAEFAVVRCRGRHIELENLTAEILELAAPRPAPALPSSGASRETPLQTADDERARIINALGRTAGNRTRAARVLGVSRATFYRRLEELGLQDAGRDDAAAGPDAPAPPPRRRPAR